MRKTSPAKRRLQDDDLREEVEYIIKDIYRKRGEREKSRSPLKYKNPNRLRIDTEYSAKNKGWKNGA